MKITISKIKRELEKKDYVFESKNMPFFDDLIKDIRNIIDEQLKSKGISIK